MADCSPKAPREWQELPDEALLDLRLCDLRLSIRESALRKRITWLHAELVRAGIKFRPHVWLSEEWFSPDGVPGIAIPFYLAHPRLARLERRQMLECEGAGRIECMKILRHEAGHALDNAYRLHNRVLWRSCFGRYSTPYPKHYVPALSSRDHVLHLNAWYAQAHPAEDFAETFAVWLTEYPDKWRQTYADWGALTKLEAVDSMLNSILGRQPVNKSRKRVEPLSSCRTTLREHYTRKREYYQVGLPTFFDPDLMNVFSSPEGTLNPSAHRARPFLARIRREVCNAVSEATGVHHYTVDQLMKRIQDRAHHLKLVLKHDEQQTRAEMAALLSTLVLKSAQHGRIPL